MKLNTVKRSVETGGMPLSVAMRIDLNPKSFSVLSDDMYSDSVSTIVRELSSNAYDSHKEAGKSDVPFNVCCPSSFDPYFAVEDFGTGLRYYGFNAKIRNDKNEDVVGDVSSTIFIDGDIRDLIANIEILIINGIQTVEVGNILYDRSTNETVIRIAGEFHGDDVPIEFDDVLVLYSTYFRSTKEDTNDYIGAYGLGSKTPFAYTDNFMVRNRFNGTERVYNIYTDENGMPQVSLMGMLETDECNGLEVKIDVAPEDYDEFAEAIKGQLKYFDPQPTICNEPVDMPKILYTGKHFMIMENDCSRGYSWNRRSLVSVGNNAYETDHTVSSFFQDNVVLKFDVGELMVTATREELKDDSDTRDTIKLREQAAIEEYRTYVLDTLETDGMTDYERAAFVNDNADILDLRDDRIKELVGNPNYNYHTNVIRIPLTGWGDYTNFEYDEVDVTDEDGNVIDVKYQINKYHTNRVHALRWSSFGYHDKKTEKISGELFIEPDENVLIFIRDNSYAFLKKMKFYINDNDIDRSCTKILVLDAFTTEKTQNALKMLKSVISHVATFVKLSDIVLPKNLSTTPSDYCPTPVARLFTPGDHSFRDPKSWDEVFTPLTKIENDEKTYIIQTHRGSVDDIDSTDLLFVDRYISGGFKWDTEVTILALSRAKYEKAVSYGFKDVSELIADLKKKITIPVDVPNNEKMCSLIRTIRNNSIISLMDGLTNEELEQIPVDNPIRKIMRVREIIQKRYVDRRRKYNALLNIANLVEQETPEAMEIVNKTIDNVTEMCDNISEKLILVAGQSYWNFREDTKRKALIDYINMVFNKTENTGENDE